MCFLLALALVVVLRTIGTKVSSTVALFEKHGLGETVAAEFCYDSALLDQKAEKILAQRVANIKAMLEKTQGGGKFVKINTKTKRDQTGHGYSTGDDYPAVAVPLYGELSQGLSPVDRGEGLKYITQDEQEDEGEGGRGVGGGKGKNERGKGVNGRGKELRGGWKLVSDWKYDIPQCTGK